MNIHNSDPEIPVIPNMGSLSKNSDQTPPFKAGIHSIIRPVQNAENANSSSTLQGRVQVSDPNSDSDKGQLTRIKDGFFSFLNHSARFVRHTVFRSSSPNNDHLPPKPSLIDDSGDVASPNSFKTGSSSSSKPLSESPLSPSPSSDLLGATEPPTVSGAPVEPPALPVSAAHAVPQNLASTPPVASGAPLASAAPVEPPTPPVSAAHAVPQNLASMPPVASGALLAPAASPAHAAPQNPAPPQPLASGAPAAPAPLPSPPVPITSPTIVVGISSSSKSTTIDPKADIVNDSNKSPAHLLKESLESLINSLNDLSLGPITLPAVLKRDVDEPGHERIFKRDSFGNAIIEETYTLIVKDKDGKPYERTLKRTDYALGCDPHTEEGRQKAALLADVRFEEIIKKYVLSIAGGPAFEQKSLAESPTIYFCLTPEKEDMDVKGAGTSVEEARGEALPTADKTKYLGITSTSYKVDPNSFERMIEFSPSLPAGLLEISRKDYYRLIAKTISDESTHIKNLAQEPTETTEKFIENFTGRISTNTLKKFEENQKKFERLLARILDIRKELLHASTAAESEKLQKNIDAFKKLAERCETELDTLSKKMQALLSENTVKSRISPAIDLTDPQKKAIKAKEEELMKKIDEQKATMPDKLNKALNDPIPI